LRRQWNAGRHGVTAVANQQVSAFAQSRREIDPAMLARNRAIERLAPRLIVGR